MSKKVYIATAVHNDLDYTKKLLSSVKAQTYGNLELVIVDDGSSDLTESYLREQSSVKVISGDGNLWWTGALYLAVEEILSRSEEVDYILTVNNDCVFGKNYVEKLVAAGGLDKKSITGSVILDINDRKKVIGAGVNIDWSARRVVVPKTRFVENSKDNISIDTDTDALPTKGTLFPVKVFKEIGNFDKRNFPHYLSDYEFTIRAKSRGYNLQVNHEAKIYTDTSRSGLGREVPEKITLKEFKSLMFTKRSSVNIVDHYRFIKKCCPQQHKYKNYLLLIGKLFHYLFKIRPLHLIPKFVVKTKKKFGLEGVTLISFR